MTRDEILTKLNDDMQLRGLSETTRHHYTRQARIFQNFFEKPADQLGIPEIQQFLLHLARDKKLANGSINAYNSTLRFLYGVTLDTPLNLWHVPRLKQNRALPKLPTEEEVRLILANAPNLMYKAMFMTIYGSGLRISEALNLKVSDVDSRKMRLFISQGKGGKDRFATLSLNCLNVLREYWKEYKPTDYLFLSRLKKPPTRRAANDAFHKAIKQAGIKKHATLHTLRHCFATHLLNNDTNLFHIKSLLGHATIRSTAWYLHYNQGNAFKVQSPLDSYNGKQNG